METPGIEPGSDRQAHQPSTSIVRYLISTVRHEWTRSSKSIRLSRASRATAVTGCPDHKLEATTDRMIQTVRIGLATLFRRLKRNRYWHLNFPEIFNEVPEIPDSPTNAPHSTVETDRPLIIANHITIYIIRSVKSMGLPDLRALNQLSSTKNTILHEKSY